MRALLCCPGDPRLSADDDGKTSFTVSLSVDARSVDVEAGFESGYGCALSASEERRTKRT